MKDNTLINTLKHIAQLSKGIEIDLDEKGNLRSLTTNNKDGFTKECINLPTIKNYLQSANIKLELTDITPFAFGYRMTFRQMAVWQKEILPVYGGAVHLGMNKEGKIFSFTSTLQYESIKSEPGPLLNKTEAIKLATSSCKLPVASSHANLLLLVHNDQMQLAYEVTLVYLKPGKSDVVLILADTGKIIERRPRCLNLRCSKISSLIKARALLKTPDVKNGISGQISKVLIEHLPNPQALRSAYFDMFAGRNTRTVCAKADGSYCYSARNSEFAAVSVFLSLTNQIGFYLETGLKQPEQTLPVVVDDPSVRDNAYFDPLRYEMHLGVGTSPMPGGLTKRIAFDLGVANHEFGHVVAYWQTVNGELSGIQGAALGEAIGDVLGALTMDYMSRIWYAKQFGCELTKRDLKDDARIIGKYALPPLGIRTQKNSRSLPNDIGGEPHADGLIVGGALADLLIAMSIQPGKSIEKQIRLFTKLNLMALALLPGYQVMFSDMLRGLITADLQICNGSNRALIEQCFRSHGIVLNTTAVDYL